MRFNATAMPVSTQQSAYPNLPPPTTSSSLQVFTDSIGGVWVAKSTVNGGAWKPARDALHAKITRNAAFTVQTANAYLNLEGVVFDTYGMFSGSGGIGGTASGFIFPVAGIYRYTVQAACNATASGQWLSVLARLNQAGSITACQVATSLTTSLYSTAADAYKFNAGDTLTMMLACGTAGGLAGVTGQAATFITVNYLGTG